MMCGWLTSMQFKIRFLWFQSNGIRQMSVKHDLDRTDFGILRLLMSNAVLSNKQIAAEVGLAPSSCHERLKSLRRRGVLLGSHAEVDLKSLGLAVEALLFVQLSKLDARQVNVFIKDVGKIPHVRAVFLISGHFDLVAHVAVRDMEQLKEVISEHFNRHACVTRAETAVVFNRVMQHEIPIAAADPGSVTQERAKAPTQNKGRQRGKR
jgi:DNA-binding Lrp family transcriptional regulator